MNLIPTGQVADVQWEITTDRTNFSADLTFHYLDSEISGITEANLTIFEAATAAGPFTDLVAVIDTAKNRATVTGVTNFSVFALAEIGAIPVELSVFSVD